MPTRNDKPEDYILLGKAIPGKYVNALKIKKLVNKIPTHIEIYHGYVWGDGSGILFGYPSCTLTFDEFVNISAASLEVLQKITAAQHAFAQEAGS